MISQGVLSSYHVGLETLRAASNPFGAQGMVAMSKEDMMCSVVHVKTRGMCEGLHV
jgi:hypothetical protein